MNQEEHNAPAIPGQVGDWLTARRHDPGYRRRAIDLLLQLVRIDTTPKADPAACADADRQVFDIIAGHLAACSPNVQIERLPIRAQIGDHPYFTLPYYASGTMASGSGSGSRTELVRHVYGDRGNLFARLPNPGCPVLAANAHIDTVAPYIPGRCEGDIVFGRGSLDDKGPCLVMMLAMELLAQIADRFDIRPACELLCEFVTDEETGGNGSLSAALEKQKGAFDAMVVLEATDLKVYPANRGVVWYAARLDAADGTAWGRDVLLEAMAFVVGSLGHCGDKIKAESDHPLFPHRPVQTCHGMLAEFGQHPSRVNDYIPLRLSWQGELEADVRAHVADALAEYCRQYGDKTGLGEGEAVLEKHLAWTDVSGGGAVLEVFGLAGHMGSVDRLDGAITKAAAIIRKLVKARQRHGRDWPSLTITLKDRRDLTRLVMEGGQGFVPTHEMEDVAGRMREAAAAGVRAYTSLMGMPDDAISCETTFEKLHNAAFIGPLDGPALNALLAIGRQLGIYGGEPLRGFDASCDARIFAREFPKAEIITFGPGQLAQAHANDEHVDIEAILTTVEALVRLALTYGR